MKRMQNPVFSILRQGATLLTAATLCLGCLSFLPLLPALATEKKTVSQANFVTIQELYEQTRSGWQGTYTVPKGSTRGAVPDGYTFTVDVPIQVPQVDRISIVELRLNKDIFEDETCIDRAPSRDDGYLICSTLPEYESQDYFSFSTRNFFEAEGGQAENNPLTPEQAKIRFHELAQKYFQTDNFRIRVQVPFQTTVRPDDYSQKWHQTLDSAPYVMEGEQVFEGVPLLASHYSNTRYFASSRIRMNLFGPDLYDFEGSSLKQTGMLYEDVPLLPWADIQQAIEDELMTTGQVLDVYSIELGYELVITLEGPNTHAGYIGDRRKYPEATFNEIYHVRPIWYLRGYTFDPGARQNDPMPEEITRSWRAFLDPNQQGICIDAQSGEVVYRFGVLYNKYPNVFPTILTWDDVGGKK